MTIADKATLKTYFETGDRPTQAQFSDLIDSTMRSSLTTMANAIENDGVTGILSWTNASTVESIGGAFGLSLLETVTTADAFNLLNDLTATIAAITSTMTYLQNQITDLGALPATIIGDGVTIDSTAFANYESQTSGHWVDLRGKAYRITSLSAVPDDNYYVNGYWKVYDADGNADILYPAPNTLERSVCIIDTGARYTFLTQGGGIDTYKGNVWLRYSDASDHGGSDSTPVFWTSIDRGRSFTAPQKPLTANEKWMMSTGIVDGQQVGIVRTNNTLDVHQLISRRLYEWKEDTTLLVTTVNGDSHVALKFSATDFGGVNAGLKPGDQVRLFDPSASVGGISLSGIYTISAVSAAVAIQVSAGLSAASSQTESPITISTEFYQEAFVTAVVSGAINISLALKNVGALTTAPSVIADMATIPNSFGDIIFGLQVPGMVGGYIARINNLLTGNPVVQYVTNIDTTAGLEPTVCRDNDTGKLYGFLRESDPTTNPIKFWWAADSNMTSPVVTNGPANFGRDATTACTIVDGVIYGVTTGDRRSSTANNAGPVGLYLLKASADQAETLGFNAFDFIHLKDLYYADADDGAGSPVGQADICALDSNTLLVAYANQSFPVKPNLVSVSANTTVGSGQPNIEIMSIKLNHRKDWKGLDIPTYVQNRYLPEDTSN